MKRLALILLLVPLLAIAAEPEVKVRSRLLPADSVLVGGTLTLQIDLLVDTWFSQPPELPRLTLDGAVVFAPSGEASHLNEKIDGKAFFGLRFAYQITPQRAQDFAIPALDIRLQPGQASGPLIVQSPPLRFVARPPAGATADDQRLVATSVTFTQALQASHEPLRVGDSVTRRLHVQADGAQAMLIPPPAFADVDGLKRYVQSPTVKPVSDGRGGVTGGMRDDAVTYVVTREGDFQLPAIELSWWEAGTGAAHKATLPALEVSASGVATYQAPFSISEDLRELGRRAQVRVAGHWLLLGAALLVLAGVAVAVRLWGAPVRMALARWRERRRSAWLASPEYAWRQVGPQLRGRPAQLGALYLWLRRSTGHREMRTGLEQTSVDLQEPLLVFLRTRYGRGQAGKDSAPAELVAALPALRRNLRGARRSSTDGHSLRPLNP
ncbi:BatD family protein [Pseudomonas sp. PDNC002]|uniref:BatD family protein n=1 Tax=Pseudomonas sp. PDNC002 TaxID=2811422 RepID=UPI00196636A1|nr:BatD family protein [Pseudomonas sp. PDNC002]QRY77682.1 BatD family protein [Pseudomonas sp. PDNC002]